MNFYEIIKSAIKNVFSNKLRTFLTMLGIIIGVASVIAINAIGNGSKADVQKEFGKIGPGRIDIQLNSNNTRGRKAVSKDSLTMDDYYYLKNNIPYIDYITPNFSSERLKIKVMENNTKNLTIVGATEDYEKINSIELLYGNFFTNEDVENYNKVAIINDTTAKKIFGHVDESIIGQDIIVKSWKGNQKFTVLGIAKNSNAEIEQMYGDFFGETIFVPVTTALRFSNEKYLNSITAYTNNINYVNEIADEITKTLHSYRENNNKYTATTSKSYIDSLNQVSNTMTLLVSSIAGISLLVGGIGIMNIMLVTVTERTREIGIRKSIGAKNKDILFQFISESIVLTVSAGIIGIIIGYLASRGISKIMPFESVVSIQTIVFSVTISTIIGLVFGVYPARKASKLNPIDALNK